MKKTLLTIGIVLAAGISVAACSSQYNPPSTSDIQNNVQYFNLPDVLTPKGNPVICVVYGSGTGGYSSASHSWFSFACDFDGTAKFPSGS